jgi:hypothetical protein
MELTDLGKAILEWARIRNRITLLTYDVETEFDNFDEIKDKPLTLLANK